MAVKKRKRGPSLDEKYLGAEPIFTPEQDNTDMRAWTKDTHWYNYFYKSKDYMPTTLQFTIQYCGYNKTKLSFLKNLPSFKYLKYSLSLPRSSFTFARAKLNIILSEVLWFSLK